MTERSGPGMTERSGPFFPATFLPSYIQTPAAASAQFGVVRPTVCCPRLPRAFYPSRPLYLPHMQVTLTPHAEELLRRALVLYLNQSPEEVVLTIWRERTWSPGIMRKWRRFRVPMA